MSWTNVVWSINAGICLSLAGVHPLVWLRNRSNWLSLVFSSWAAAVAASALFELAMMHAQTPEQYGELVRWIHMPFGVATFAYIAFVRLYLRAGRLWLMWIMCGLNALRIVMNFASAQNVSFSTITALRQVTMWGEGVAVPIGEASP